MRSGRLNRPGEIYTVTQSYNDAGDETETETKVADTWIKFVSAAGREYEAAKQLNAEVTHVMRIRFNPDITLTPDDLIKSDGRTFRIMSLVNEREARQTWLITSMEVV